MSSITGSSVCWAQDQRNLGSLEWWLTLWQLRRPHWWGERCVCLYECVCVASHFIHHKIYFGGWWQQFSWIINESFSSLHVVNIQAEAFELGEQISFWLVRALIFLKNVLIWNSTWVYISMIYFCLFSIVFPSHPFGKRALRNLQDGQPVGYPSTDNLKGCIVILRFQFSCDEPEFRQILPNPASVSTQ